MPERAHSDEEIQAAVEALSEPGRFSEAESVVAVAAPGLQRILAQALDSGGWFAESHESEVGRVAAIEDPAERLAAARLLLAEEARVGMLVGVAIGWALRGELAGEGPGSGAASGDEAVNDAPVGEADRDQADDEEDGSR